MSQPILSLLTHLKFVGNRSTITVYTKLMPREVSASKIHERARFCVELLTKYNPTVTPPATSRLKTERKSQLNWGTVINLSINLLKKNLDPNRWTQRGSHKLVGMQTRPMISVCR